MRPANSELFPQSQRRRHHRAARVRSPGSEIVVGFIGMSQFAVCECRLNRSAENLRGDNSGNLLATIAASELDRQTSGGQLGSGNHGGEGVQNVMFRLPHHILRQRAIASLSHICAELFHGGTDFLTRGRCQPGKRCSGGDPDRVLQQTTAGQGSREGFTPHSCASIFFIHSSLSTLHPVRS